MTTFLHSDLDIATCILVGIDLEDTFVMKFEKIRDKDVNSRQNHMLDTFNMIFFFPKGYR